MLITSAVAILFSISSSDTCPRSDLCCRLSIGRSAGAKVRPSTAFFFFLWGGVVYFYAGARTQRAQHFVAAGDDFVALFQSLDHFDVGGACDPGVDRNKFCFVIAQYEYALNFLVVFYFGSFHRWGCRLHRTFFILSNQISLATNRQRLDGDRECVSSSRSRDLSSRGKAGTQVFGRILQRYYYLEIFRFLTGGCLLRSGNSGRSHDGVVADFGHYCFENLFWNRVNRYLCGLAHLDVYDISFVNFYFSGDD